MDAFDSVLHIRVTWRSFCEFAMVVILVLDDIENVWMDYNFGIMSYIWGYSTFVFLLFGGFNRYNLGKYWFNQFFFWINTIVMLNVRN